MNSKDKFFFTSQLFYWNIHNNGRKMPWKGEKNPYKIWISEIILQQTRVDQGLNYYNRFIKKYPTLQELAAAPEADVFKLWEGLGYYSRCKNIISSARHITTTLNGSFPDQFDTIISLKGVGRYTASAIASFAFDLPHAVVDGNVYRLLSRYFGIKTPINSNEGKKYFDDLANKLLNKSTPGIYNQAIMDFGASICKPVPLCIECPLKAKCIAFKNNSDRQFPVKEKKKQRRTRWFYYFVAEYDDCLLIKKRVEKDIWQNLHELVLLESNRGLSTEEIYKSKLFKNFAGNSRILDISNVYQQHLTHQTIKGCFIYVQLTKPKLIHGYKLEKRDNISKLAFPKYINSYFQESRYFQAD